MTLQMDTQVAARSLPENFGSFWRYMQRIEFCRHRADMAELSAENGSEAFRDEMARAAQEWRDLAQTIEQLEQIPDASAWRQSNLRG